MYLVGILSNVVTLPTTADKYIQRELHIVHTSCVHCSPVVRQRHLLEKQCVIVRACTYSPVWNPELYVCVCSAREHRTLCLAPQGSFKSYVDIILFFFDHLLISMCIFTFNVDKNRNFRTVYPPHLVHVIFERPQPFQEKR